MIMHHHLGCTFSSSGVSTPTTATTTPFSQQQHPHCAAEMHSNAVETFYGESHPLTANTRLTARIQGKLSLVVVPVTKVRVAVAVIGRKLVPVLVRVYYAYFEKINLLRFRFITHILALALKTLRRSRPLLRLSNKPANQSESTIEKLEECVDVHVLFSPLHSDHKIDVIFIHGLHGGVDRTWKQGRWQQRQQQHRKQQSQAIAKVTRSTSEGSLNRLPTRVRRKLSRALSIWSYKRCCHTDTKNVDNEWEFVNDDATAYEEVGYSNCWPKDWIPKDCPEARVIAINYTTDILWRPVWIRKKQRTDMVERSNEMIRQLLRLEVGKRPIVWVGHSKGGLFIKQILVNAHDQRSTNTDMDELFSRSKSIMFYSVPHKGSNLADVEVPLLRRSVELKEIQRNCDFILDLHQRFIQICQSVGLDSSIFSFIETSLTLMTFVYLKIVPYESADPDIGQKCDLPLDHREICKPTDRECCLYVELINLIRKHYNEPI